MPRVIIDEEYIRNFFIERGSALIKMEGNKVFFSCKVCGKETDIYSIHHIKTFERQTGGQYHFQCKECYRKVALQKKLKKTAETINLRNKKKDMEFKELFLKEGSEMLSDYVGINFPVTFKCKQCGEVETLSSLDKVLKQEHRFLCKKCQYKIRGENSAKKQRKYTKEVVARKLKEVGSVLLSYSDTGRRPFTASCLSCKEGVFSAPSSKKFFNNKQYRRVLCKTCLHKFISKPKITKAVVEDWLKGNGSKLIKYRGNSLRIEFLCKQCGGVGSYYSFSSLRRNNSSCLCAKCRLENRCGENAYNYNPNLTEEDRKKKRIMLPEYLEWIKQIRIAADKKCIISGERVKRGHCHHLFSWKKHPEVRFAVWNGVFLSPKEHYLFHIIYGRKEFTFQDFKAFYKEKTGKTYLNKEAELFFNKISS